MADHTTKVAIVGAAGRMGISLLTNADARDDLCVTAALVSPNDPEDLLLGPQQIKARHDLDALADAQVVIDFSAPAATVATAKKCANLGLPLVSGTTGLTGEQLKTLDDLAEEIPILHAANFSVGVNLLAHLVEQAAGAFDGADIEIFEAHHRHKVDAPSGTAKLLGRAAARGRNAELAEVATWAREGHTGPRTDDEIGFQVLRGGDIVGEHTAYFCVAGERLELTHRATDRGIFARGALRAARWIVGRPPGRYSMNDVLFDR